MRRPVSATNSIVAALAVAALLFAPASARAAKSKGVITVVPVGGAPLAREVSAELEKKGFLVERGGSLTEPPAPLPVPVEPGKACVAEGHALAFRLDFASAIRVLTDCEERLGPSLARGEGTPVLSALLVELAAAAIAAGERDRARATFVRLARVARATPPDPNVHPPDVIARWEEVRRAPEPTRPVFVEATPPWTRLWIDGRPVEPGARIPLAVGPHYVIADAAGFAPWAGTLLLEPDSSKLSPRLVPLEGEERQKSVRARAGWSIRPDDAGIADPLTDAFGGPVLLVGATQAMLLLPRDASRGQGALVGGRFNAAGEGAATVIARGVDRRLGGKGPAGGDDRDRRALYIAGGAALGVIAAGAAAATLLGQERTRNEKDGTVTWDP